MHTLEIEVNGALKNISDWLISNKLSLNIDKSNLLFFNMNNIQETDLNMQSGNEKLEGKEYAKYLEFILAASSLGRIKYKLLILNCIKE